jgi:transcriptional regulator GlxA family with amidase domain
MSEKKLRVIILLFDDVEVLDFAGPFEVFSVTAQLSDYRKLEVKTVTKTGQGIIAKNGLRVTPDCGLEEVQQADILVLPGGDGSKIIAKDEEVLDWVKKITMNSQVTMSVCSGARILARLGYLDGKPFTTHQSVFDDILKISPKAIAMKNKRFVDNGKVMTAAGVAAGIDLSLYVVEKIFGEEPKKKTANYMEYK